MQDEPAENRHNSGLAVPALSRRRLPQFAQLAPRLPIMCGFALTAAIVRALKLPIETREIIIIFAGAAALYEWGVRRAGRQQPSVMAYCLTVTLVLAAVLLTRWQIEGLCPGGKQPRCAPTAGKLLNWSEHIGDEPNHRRHKHRHGPKHARPPLRPSTTTASSDRSTEVELPNNSRTR